MVPKLPTAANEEGGNVAQNRTKYRRVMLMQCAL
uniref:Uncharacterized protein n=1 Tax=Arundo donax TaxID=35708 RepID=A0A0A9AUB0_ARUDO